MKKVHGKKRVNEGNFVIVQKQPVLGRQLDQFLKYRKKIYLP